MAAFIVSLIVIALVYPFSNDIANKIANFAFFSLVAGVILQVLSLDRKEAETRVGQARDARTESLGPKCEDA